MRIPKALIPGWSSSAGQPVPAGQGTAGLWLRGRGPPSITAPAGLGRAAHGHCPGLRLCSGKWLWNHGPCSAHPTRREGQRVRGGGTAPVSQPGAGVTPGQEGFPALRVTQPGRDSLPEVPAGMLKVWDALLSGVLPCSCGMSGRAGEPRAAFGDAKQLLPSFP